MHVLLTADTIGGVWTYAREMVCGLVRRGVRVTLVSFGEVPEPRRLLWMDGLRNFDYRSTAFRLEWMQDSATDIEQSSEYLLRIIRETRPDILHLSQYCYGALDVGIPKVVVAHSDVVSWWMSVHGEEPPRSAWTDWYRDVVQRGIDGATTVIAPSRWMLQQVERYYGPLTSSAVVYNGRSPQLFNPHAEKDRLVISVGRLWDAAKQVSLLQQCDGGMPVVIAGAIEHPEQVFRANTPQAQGGSVEVRGDLTPEQVRSLFARSAVYAVTSRYEPFGLAPVEAAFSRCAIVANDIPSLRELWGETACYFKTNDPASLGETIAKLRADPVLRRNYAQLAYLRAKRLFTADRMVDDYLNLYAEIAAPKSVAA